SLACDSKLTTFPSLSHFSKRMSLPRVFSTRGLLAISATTTLTPASIKLTNDALRRVRAFSPASWSTMYFWPSLTTVPGTRLPQILVSPVGLVAPLAIMKKNAEVEENANSQAKGISIPRTGGFAPKEKNRKATVTKEIQDTWRITSISFATGDPARLDASLNSLVGKTSTIPINAMVEGR